MTFSERIEELLKQKNITKKEFSEAVGITQQAIYDWKKRNTVPAADVAYKIAKYLDTSVEYLVTGNETNEYKIKYETLINDIKLVIEKSI